MHDGNTNPNNEGSRRARAGVGIYDLEEDITRDARFFMNLCGNGWNR